VNILVVGNALQLKECQEKFGENHQYTSAATNTEAKSFFETNDIIFDFLTNEPFQMKSYQNFTKGILFLNTSTKKLTQLTHQVSSQNDCTIFGFCGLPTFLNRELLEVSLRKQSDLSSLEKVCKELSTEFVVVEDRVGMATPRVICMIINEAYFTVQEGTATREDIDVAMKLGTNYPYGPFEWCEKIDIRNVYQLLQSVYQETKDERYKICSLLKEESLYRNTLR
jgi:3-hydroxybutyryl-CoA dehydrogenase